MENFPDETTVKNDEQRRGNGDNGGKSERQQLQPQFVLMAVASQETMELRKVNVKQLYAEEGNKR